MSYAPDYDPTANFADDEANNVAGRSIVKTVSVDTELANISTSINALNTNLKAIQRDDNKLNDGIIEPYALSEQTRSLLAASGGRVTGDWQQNFDYLQKDAAQFGGTAYLCVTPHNSGTVFAPALWMAISGDGSSFASAAEAAASAADALASQNAADASADAADASAIAADASADAALASATNASNSAASAASVIASSIAGASQAEAEAGANNTKYMSSLRVAQAIVAQVVDATTAIKGRIALSTASLIKAGVNAVTAITPATLLAAIGFSALFESTQQTITSGGALTIAHGLGRKPVKFETVLVCQTGEFGYTAGDEVPVYINCDNATNVLGISLVPDTTNLNIRFSTSPQCYVVQAKGTGARAAFNNANWKLVIRAWG